MLYCFTDLFSQAAVTAGMSELEGRRSTTGQDWTGDGRQTSESIEKLVRGSPPERETTPPTLEMSALKLVQKEQTHYSASFFIVSQNVLLLQISLAARPGFGRLGRKYNMFTNHFEVKFSEKVLTVHSYYVEVQHDRIKLTR